MNGLVCQQCGKPILSAKVQKCPECNQWTTGVTKADYEELNRILNKAMKQGGNN
jgi:ribosomal protein L37AE/L43A